MTSYFNIISYCCYSPDPTGPYTVRRPTANESFVIPDFLPRRRPKEGSVIRKDLSHGRAITIEVKERHSVAPPVWEGGATQTESKRGNDNTYGGADVEGTRENVVVASYWYADVSI